MRPARVLVIAMVVAALALNLTTAAGASRSAGYGAPLAQWQHAYGIDSSDCPIGPCYGPLVESRPIQPEFSFVQTLRRRVVGYDEALRRGTSLLAAELQVVEQLPADVTLPHSVTVIHHDRYGHSCAVLDLYSASLAHKFGPNGPAGQGNSIGVELATVGAGGMSSYNPNAIDLAIIIPEYLDASTNC